MLFCCSIRPAGTFLPSSTSPTIHLNAAAAEVARAQPGRKHLAVHPRQLALQPHLPILSRHRRSLLLCLEPPRRPAVDNHVHRPAQLGTLVLISGTSWTKTAKQ